MSVAKVKQIHADMIELVYGGNTRVQYAGRGIHVCKQWIDNVKQFSDDMGVMPKGATLKRHDKNKAFNKDNCFWDAPIVIPVNEVKVETTTLEKELKKLDKQEITYEK